MYDHESGWTLLPAPLCSTLHQINLLPCQFNNVTDRQTVTGMKIAGDPKHPGAIIGFPAVLHTWGQTLQHHPHLHWVGPRDGQSRVTTSSPVLTLSNEVTCSR